MSSLDALHHRVAAHSSLNRQRSKLASFGLPCILRWADGTQVEVSDSYWCEI